MLWLFAMAVASVAVAASMLRLRRVRTAVRSSPNELGRLVGRSGSRQRLRRVAAEMRAKGAIWEADLLDDICGATSDGARVALANEHLGDVAARLDWGSHIPVAAARLSIATPLCAAFFSLARGRVDWSSLVPVVVCAGTGAVASLWIGREADRSASRLREGIDLLVERALRAAVSEGAQTADSQ
jgi:hypothetical protein